MKKRQFSQVFIIAILVIALAFSVTENVTAGKKIKSKKVTVGMGSAVIGVGDVITLHAYTTPTNSTDTMKWKSSNTKVATVNKYGVVTGLKEGQSKITVTTSSKKKSSCTVTVKRYLTSTEVSALISGNALTEADIKQAVDKYSFSEDSIKKLITDNSISESTIKGWIKDGTLSEDKVVELINKNTLTEDNVKKLISDNTLSEDTIKGWIKDETLSESKVTELISKNTLTKDDVTKLIHENTLSSGDVVSLIEQYQASNDTSWKDGDSVKFIGDSLPSNDKMTITAVDIKKYHVDSPGKNRTPYKYVLTFDGTFAKDDYDYTDFTITFSSSKGYGIDNRWYDFFIKNDTNISCNITTDGNKFHAVVDQYNIGMEYDMFDFNGNIYAGYRKDEF